MNDDLKEEEIKAALKKLKIKKTAGVDGIPMEAWKYAGKSLWKNLVDMMIQIWKKGNLPDDWKKSVIVPLHKRGKQDEANNYRGISLLCMAYKIYTEVIRSKLEMGVEENGLLPDFQSGFRKRKSTLDNIFVLNYIIQKVGEKGKRRKNICFLRGFKIGF